MSELPTFTLKYDDTVLKLDNAILCSGSTKRHLVYLDENGEQSIQTDILVRGKSLYIRNHADSRLAIQCYSTIQCWPLKELNETDPEQMRAFFMVCDAQPDFVRTDASKKELEDRLETMLKQASNVIHAHLACCDPKYTSDCFQRRAYLQHITNEVYWKIGDRHGPITATESFHTVIKLMHWCIEAKEFIPKTGNGLDSFLNYIDYQIKLAGTICNDPLRPPK